MNVTNSKMIILLSFQVNGVCLCIRETCFKQCLELINRTEFVNYRNNQFLISNGIHSVIVVHGTRHSNINALIMKLIELNARHDI